MGLLRHALTGLLIGAVILGSAWAGTGLFTPPDVSERVEQNRARSADRLADELAEVEAFSGERLPEGTFLVGASKVSIVPDKDKWVPDVPDSNCPDPEAYTPASKPGCILTFDRNWATTVDPLGTYVRAVAISNGEKTVVLAVLDTVGWFYGYPSSICDKCGAKDIGKTIQELTGGEVPAEGVVVASTHTHASADTLAATPRWYYEQVRDAILQASTEAVANKEPAILETGTIPAKAFNRDRRIVTRAVPDYELGWIRAYQPAQTTTQEKPGGSPGSDKEQGNANPGPPGTGDEVVVQAEKTIATLVNYAAHPTVRTDNAELHSGFVGPLTRDLENHFGGTAIFFPGGLGDQTVDRGFGTEGLGNGLARLVVQGTQTLRYRIMDNDIAIDRAEVKVPGDNVFLAAASTAGLFVRDIKPPYGGGPETSVQRKGGSNKPSCATAGPLHVVTPVGGIRIGRPGTDQRGDPGDSILIMEAPGEIFSAISLITKDYLSKSTNVFVVGIANDHIGYLIPAEIYDHTAEHGVGLLNNSVSLGNYEEVLSLSRCAGDQIQNELLRSGERLGVLGSGERV